MMQKSRFYHLVVVNNDSNKIIHYADYDVFVYAYAFLIGYGRFMMIITFSLTTDKKGCLFRLTKAYN